MLHLLLVLIICNPSDQFALYLYSLANKKGLSIPNDLSIIGFDDLPTSHFLPFTLTTIQQDIRKKATETCRILFEHINDPDKPSQSIILDVQLIERESVIDRKK